MILLSHYMPSRYTLYDIVHILAILINIFLKNGASRPLFV